MIKRPVRVEPTTYTQRYHLLDSKGHILGEIFKEQEANEIAAALNGNVGSFAWAVNQMQQHKGRRFFYGRGEHAYSIEEDGYMYRVDMMEPDNGMELAYVCEAMITATDWREEEEG